MARQSESESNAYYERARRMQRRIDILGSGVKHMLVGMEKKIQHPIELALQLDGFGEWLAEKDIMPSLASIALFLGCSKQYIYDAGNDIKRYSYYELQDATGESIDIRPINYLEELDYINHGVNICMTHFIPLDKLIEDYCKKHFTTLTDEQLSRIHALDGCFVKRFHKKIQSKKQHKGILSKIHALQVAKGVYTKGKVFRRKWSKLCSVGHEKRLEDNIKELYCQIVTGSAIVKTITFGEVLQVFKNLAEVEWIEVGATARNPAMSIFLLMNNSGFASVYQNKTVTQYVPTMNALEDAGYQKRLDELIESVRLIERK